MNDISLIYKNIEVVPWENEILVFIATILKDLDIDSWEFSVTLCDDSFITVLNTDYRGKNEPTDVLTFALGDNSFPIKEIEPLLYSAGDIVISLDSVKKNSEYFKVEYPLELMRVVIHGILHLKGLEHKTNNHDEEMLVLQEELLEKHGKEMVF